MRTCAKCNEEKPESEFYFNKSKNRLDYYCKSCQREYRRKHYINNKEYYKEKARRWDKNNPEKKKQSRSRVQTLIKETLTGKSCQDCGIDNWLVLEFDHRPDENKEFSISQSKHKSNEEVLREMAKCDIVCANCHRIRTMERNNSWRISVMENTQHYEC